ncbi:MAG TPA: nucleotide exchange factor GrpE [Candidatus Nitrosotenuis sp.]|nr:nucleotide exchange factor GrpE [Candidatus Nitrosotenuis sp.]
MPTDTTTASAPSTRPADIWQAIRTDIENFICEVNALKGALADKEEESRRKTKELLLNMLEVLDAFDRLFANIAPREAQADQQTRIWLGNFRSVRRLLEKKLSSEGVAPIVAPEGKAIPGFHTVAETEENLDLDNDTILQELQKGYLWNGEVLRKAQVRVVKN